MDNHHKMSASLELTVRRADGTIRGVRTIGAESSKPDLCKLEVREKDGTLVSYKEFPVKSFLQNWSEVLYHQMIGSGSVAAFKALDGNYYSTDFYKLFCLDAANNDDDYGIVVGTGNTAVAVADYTMDAMIAHGTGAGQLDYNAQQYVATITSGTDTVYQIYRTFQNGSGNTITVQEVGIVNTTDGSGVSPNPFLVLRDVEDENAAAINTAVANGQTLTVTYTFNQTQAEGFCKQMLECLESNNFNVIKNMKYIGGGGATHGINSRGSWGTWIRVYSPANEDGYGVIVGSGTGALNSTDYELGTLITHGSGAGQLSYDAVTYEDLTIVGGDITYVYKRVLTNLSGSSVTIEEAGVAVYGVSTYQLLILRRLTGTLTLAASESVTAKWTFKHSI